MIRIFGENTVAVRTQIEKIRFFKSALLTVFTLIFLASAFGLNQRLTRLHVAPGELSVDSTESASFRWHPLLFKILSFGQVPSAVDVLLLRFITDSTIAKIKNGQETELFRILNLATAIDPAFYSLYTGGANFLSIVRNDNQGALKLLLKGERFLDDRLGSYPTSFQKRYWPDPWRINFILGYLYLFELDDFPKAMASNEKMGRYPGIPLALAERAKRVQTPDGQARFALGSIEVLKKWNEDDPRVLDELETRRKIVLANQRLLAWDQAFTEGLKKAKGKIAASDYYAEFKANHGIPDVDPLGGRISLSPDHHIVSTTRMILMADPLGADPIEKKSGGE
jgi:hypothetical protein